MNRKTLALIGTLSILATLGVSSREAHARAIGAFGGRSVHNGHRDCFHEEWGSIVNDCAGEPGWQMALVIDPGGIYSPSYSAYVPSGSSIRCNNVAISKYGFYSVTPLVPNATTGYATVAPGAVNVPAGGFLMAACGIGTGSKLIAVTW